MIQAAMDNDTMVAVTPDVILPHAENMIRADIWNELGHDKKLGKALATYGWRRFSALVGNVINRHQSGRTGAGEALTKAQIERAGRIVETLIAERGYLPDRVQGEMRVAALAALTEAADEIASLRARVEALEKLHRSNASTMEEQRSRMIRWGKSHDELNTAINETRQAIDTPNIFDISRQEARMATVGSAPDAK